LHDIFFLITKVFKRLHKDGRLKTDFLKKKVFEYISE
jgi:hypothetical protein